MATGDSTTTSRKTGGVLAREPPRAASSSSSHASRKRRRAEAMADRFFPNDFPDFVAEVPDGEGGVDRPAGLHGLLSLPYRNLSDRFLRAALRLKDKAHLASFPGLVSRAPGARLIARPASHAGGGGDVGQGGAPSDGLHALHGRARDGDAAVQVLPGDRQPRGSHPGRRYCPGVQRGVQGPTVRLTNC
jgi:hypothetical protein